MKPFGVQNWPTSIKVAFQGRTKILEDPKNPTEAPRGPNRNRMHPNKDQGDERAVMVIKKN